METVLKFGMPWKKINPIIDALGLVMRPCRHGVRLTCPVTGETGVSARKDPSNPANANGYLVKYLKRVIRKRLRRASSVA